MTKHKKLSIFTAFFMLFACLFSFAGISKKNANAAMPGYTGQSTIYYFCDLYPSIDYATLTSNFGNEPTVLLDRQAVNNQEFTALVNSNYFSPFSEGQVVVIDIKTFVPTSLSGLIGSLKQQGCTVVLVTAEHLELSANSIYVDAYYESNLERYEAFIYNSIDHIKNQSGNSSIQLLLDNNMFNGENAGDWDTLTANCPFSRILLERLLAFDYAFNPSEGEDSPVVQPLLHIGNGIYINLVEGGSPITTLDDSLTTYALGSWNLDSDFYDHLYYLHNANRLQDTLVMEGNKIVYSSQGLPIITEFELGGGWEADEATDLVNDIRPYVN